MITKGLMSSNSSEWATLQATPQKAKCKKFYTKEQNGLIQDWSGEVVFCNPPYGREISAWVEKRYNESQRGAKVVMLIPARTGTRYFHEFIYKKAELRFIKGRLKFNDCGVGVPFPSMVVVFK